MIITYLYITIRIAKDHEIGKIKKCNFGTRATIPPVKLNRPLFPNQVKLWSANIDLVFVNPKELEYKIWVKSEP